MSYKSYSLIETVKYANLLGDIGWNDMVTAWDKLEPLLEGHGKVAVGIAYVLGMNQGVHDERQRRKGGVE